MAKKETTAEQLSAQLAELKKQNADQAVKEIDAICKKYNVILVTNVEVHLNGQPLGIQVRPL